MTKCDVSEVEQRGPIRRARVHHLEYGLEVTIQVDRRTGEAFENQHLIAVIPPAVRNSAREADGLARPDSQPLTIDFRRQRAGGDHHFFILEVVNVQWGALAMRWQRAPKRKHCLSIARLFPNLENLAGVPVLQSQRRWARSIRRHTLPASCQT